METSKKTPRPSPGQYDPGRTLGILSIVAALAQLVGVLAIVGPMAAVIMGHLSRKKSREAGFADNTFGRWGFILGVIMLIVGLVTLLGVIIFIVFSLMTDPAT